MYVGGGEFNISEEKDKRGSQKVILPDNLTIEHSIYMNGSSVEILPDSLAVSRNLTAKKSSIISIPSAPKIDGWIDLVGGAIKEINGLTIKDSIFLQDSELVSVRGEVHIGNCMYLCDTPITHFGDNVTIEQDLNLADTNIITFGNVHVKGCVFDFDAEQFVSNKPNGRSAANCLAMLDGSGNSDENQGRISTLKEYILSMNIYIETGKPMYPVSQRRF